MNPHGHNFEDIQDRLAPKAGKAEPRLLAKYPSRPRHIATHRRYVLHSPDR
jgi:hypothetical protein